MTAPATKPQPAGSQVQTKAMVPMDSVRSLLEMNRQALEAACTKVLSADRLIQLMFVECRKNPKLADCTAPSLMGAMFTMAQLGLAPGPLGLIYPIPFQNRKSGRVEIQLIIGYKGLIELARRSEEIATVQAHVVREGDTFSYTYGLSPDLIHKPALVFDPKARVTHIYAIGSLKNGYHQFEVMSAEEITAHKQKYSKAAQDGPWVSAEDEMRKKTVLRRVCKLLPASTEMKTAVSLDELAEAQLSQHLGALPDVPVKDSIEDLEGEELAAIQEGLKQQQAQPAIQLAEESEQDAGTVEEAEVLEPPKAKAQLTPEPEPISDTRWIACIRYLDTLKSLQQLKVKVKKVMNLDKLPPLVEPVRTGFVNTMNDYAKKEGIVLAWPKE